MSNVFTSLGSQSLVSFDCEPGLLRARLGSSQGSRALRAREPSLSTTLEHQKHYSSGKKAHASRNIFAKFRPQSQGVAFGFVMPFWSNISLTIFASLGGAQTLSKRLPKIPQESLINLVFRSRAQEPPIFGGGQTPPKR